jgi:hypothetical protein
MLHTPHRGRRSTQALRLSLAIALAIGMLGVASPGSAAPGSLSVAPLGGELSPTMLAEDLAGAGVTVSNVSYTGDQNSAGRFTDSSTAPDLIVGFDGGVVLSTGMAVSAIGPNTSESTSTGFGNPGDPDLNTLLPAGQTTFDATVLSFDFMPNDSTISFRYVFGSEEYNEFVNEGFNDVFGFFINGTNCATIDGDRVSVDSINGGNPFGTNASRPELFRNNSLVDPGPATINTQLDGLTTVLTCNAPVTANATNTMKLAIADVGDDIFDSAVFIEAGSLTTEPPPGEAPGAPTDVNATPGDGAAVVSWNPPASDGGSAIDGYEITCTAVADPENVHVVQAGAGSTSAPVSGLTNDIEYTCTVRAHNEIGFGPPSEPSAPFTPTETGDGGPTFQMTVDTSEGGILLIAPEGPDNLGTTGKIKVPKQPGPAKQVVVTATLFGVPGEEDETCGGNVCVGQGIEWSVSDPSAIKKMRVKFIEAPFLTHGGKAEDATVYKDGVAVADCVPGLPSKDQAKPCIVWRYTTRAGGWQVTVLVDGSDPKGRI